jgi:hypothetical protein
VKLGVVEAKRLAAECGGVTLAAVRQYVATFDEHVRAPQSKTIVTVSCPAHFKVADSLLVASTSLEWLRDTSTLDFAGGGCTPILCKERFLFQQFGGRLAATIFTGRNLGAETSREKT